ncbi:transposase [Kitasatospora fiedleri]|uniref:transposase n=1 Tax=Kitasatospora fiedleri TaxID=2991545 RepID=UPI00249A17D2|nr:transposase [Kitasatospora fiedleri]
MRPPAREHRFGWLAPMVVWPTARWLLPAPARRPQGGGTRRRDDEALFAAVSFILTSHAPWRAVPPGFGVSWQHTHRSFRHWRDHGTWDRLALVAHSRQAPDQVRYWADRLAASAAGRGYGREPEDPG